MSILSAPYFHDEIAAIGYLESIIWPEGPVCPHCQETKRINKLKGTATRPGLHKCYACRKQFTVKVGTVFESSHIPLHKWMQAAFLLASSKKGISSHQLHRTLEVTYKTAWFMTHRLREAMRELKIEPVGGGGKVVEVDETYIGNKGKQAPGARGYAHKEKVFSLLERGGRVQSYHVPRVNADTLRPIMLEQMAADAHLMTDDAGQYRHMHKDFKHDVIAHSIREYVRGDVHTNTVEGYFSIFKRGMTGVYQHCSGKHLKRYLAEFDFRYNERKIHDSSRTHLMLAGIVGKRLTYRDSSALAD